MLHERRTKRQRGQLDASLRTNRVEPEPTHLLVYILHDINRSLVPDLDVRDVKTVDQSLNSFDLPRGSSGESEDSEVVVPRLDETDDLAVRLVSGSFVSFVFGK